VVLLPRFEYGTPEYTTSERFTISGARKTGKKKTTTYEFRGGQTGILFCQNRLD
jgi:hypothetical protein